MADAPRAEMLADVLAAWRPSLPAGSSAPSRPRCGSSPSRWRRRRGFSTLGLVEILIAGMVSRRFFQQAPGLRDIIGMVLVVGGIALLFNA